MACTGTDAPCVRCTGAVHPGRQEPGLVNGCCHSRNRGSERLLLSTATTAQGTLEPLATVSFLASRSAKFQAPGTGHSQMTVAGIGTQFESPKGPELNTQEFTFSATWLRVPSPWHLCPSDTDRWAAKSPDPNSPIAYIQSKGTSWAVDARHPRTSPPLP